MMDFPSSPSVGQIFTGPGGIQYIWNGVAWMQVMAGNVRLVASGPNLIVNPNFDISQENGDTAGTVNAFYIADQWMHVTASAGATQGARALIDSDYAGSIANTAAQASLVAAAQFRLTQVLEGLMTKSLRWGYADAVPAVLNFKARANQAGTYSAALFSQNAPVQSFVYDFALPAASGNAWNEFTVPIPAPPAGGNWAIDNSGASALAFTHSVGSTMKAAALGWNSGTFVGGPGITNNSAVSLNNLVIKDVQLRADPDGAGVCPKFQPQNFNEELARCQRYWQAYGSQIIAGYNGASGFIYHDWTFPWMRTTPTITPASTSNSNAQTLALNLAVINHARISCQIIAAGAGYVTYDTKLNARM